MLQGMTQAREQPVVAIRPHWCTSDNETVLDFFSAHVVLHLGHLNTIPESNIPSNLSDSFDMLLTEDFTNPYS